MKNHRKLDETAATISLMLVFVTFAAGPLLGQATWNDGTGNWTNVSDWNINPANTDFHYGYANGQGDAIINSAAANISLDNASSTTVISLDSVKLSNGQLNVSNGTVLAPFAASIPGGTLNVTNGGAFVAPVVGTSVNSFTTRIEYKRFASSPEFSPFVLNFGPTAAELQGDFSANGGVVYNASVNPPVPFPNNVLPAGVLGPYSFQANGIYGGPAVTGAVTVGGNAASPAALVTVNGAGSSFTAGDTLAINATGSLQVTKGGAVYVGWQASNSAWNAVFSSYFAIDGPSTVGEPNGYMTNSGAVLIDSAGSLSICCSGYYNVRARLGGSYNQTAGSTDVNGTLIAAGGVYINGGTLSGSGTVNGSVINGATVYPGDPVTLTIKGNYTQTANGVLVIDVSSATDFTMLDVTGNAILGGTVDFDFLNGYVPGANTNFAFLDVAGSVSGDFTGFDFSGIHCPSCAFNLSSLSLNTGSIAPTAATATPEAASLLLFGTGLLALAWLLPRSRKITHS